MTSIVLADDHPLVRQGPRAVFQTAGDLDVGAGRQRTRRGQAVRRASPRRRPHGPADARLHGIEATKQVSRAAPETAVLVLTMFNDDDSVFAAPTAGAAGYLLKGSNGDDIVAAVRAAASGQAVFGPALAKRLQTWFSRPPATPIGRSLN